MGQTERVGDKGLSQEAVDVPCVSLAFLTEPYAEIATPVYPGQDRTPLISFVEAGDIAQVGNGIAFFKCGNWFPYFRLGEVVAPSARQCKIVVVFHRDGIVD